jgi:hypothetical protein
MPKKKSKRVLWSKDDVKTLKTMAKEKRGRDKIAKALKRTPAAVSVKAATIGISLSTR